MTVRRRSWILAGVLSAVAIIAVIVIMGPGELSKGTVQKTRSQLRSNDTAIQLSALHFLAERGPDTRLRSEIEAHAGSPDPRIRLATARAIGRYRDRLAVEVLKTLVSDSAPEVAEEARRQLDKCRTVVQGT